MKLTFTQMLVEQSIKVLLFPVWIKAQLHRSVFYSVGRQFALRCFFCFVFKVSICFTQTGTIRHQEVFFVPLGGSVRRLHPSVETNPALCEGPAEEPSAAV